MITRRLALAIACALLVVLVAAAMAAAAPQTAPPPGKTAAAASLQRVGVGDALPLPGMDFNDTLVAPDYEDLWTVYLAAGQQITVTMSASEDEDFDMALWPPGTTDISDPDAAVASSRHYEGDESFIYDVPGGASGTYYIDVWSYSTSVTVGSYHLTVAIGEPTIISPIPSADFSDALDAPGYEDLWTVSAAPGQQLIVTMDSPSGGDFDLCLWAPGTTEFTYHYLDSLVISAHYSGVEDFKYIVPAGAGGAYIVDVWSDTLGGAYRLRVNKQSPSTTAVRITPPAVPLRCVTGRSYTSYGTLKPLHYVDDSSVRAQFQKYSGGRWRAAGTRTGVNKNYNGYTRYKISYSFYGSGHGTMRWRARGVHLKDALHPSKASAWRYFTVRI